MKSNIDGMVKVEDSRKPTRLALEGKGLTPLTDVQIQQIQKHAKTPTEFIEKRVALGGGEWNYVRVQDVMNWLDDTFGLNGWEFRIIQTMKEENQVVIAGQLTVVYPNGSVMSEENFGSSEIKVKKAGGILDLGNDYKAARADCLKKCASRWIARDIYGLDEFLAQSLPPPQSKPIPTVHTAVQSFQRQLSTPSPQTYEEICRVSDELGIDRSSVDMHLQYIAHGQEPSPANLRQLLSNLMRCQNGTLKFSFKENGLLWFDLKKQEMEVATAHKNPTLSTERRVNETT